MFIDVEKIKQEKSSSKQFEFFLEKSQLLTEEAKIIFKTPMKVDIMVLATSEGIAVDGVVSGSAYIECHRCLEQFSIDMDILISEKIIKNNSSYYLIDDEEQQLSNIKNAKIDLGPIIEQAIYLSLPMKLLCKQDCLGLCAKCGCNLNVQKCACEKDDLDPRLSVLQQVFKK